MGRDWPTGSSVRGRPLILMPGFSGSQEWIEHGLAAAFAELDIAA